MASIYDFENDHINLAGYPRMLKLATREGYIEDDGTWVKAGLLRHLSQDLAFQSELDELSHLIKALGEVGISVENLDAMAEILTPTILY